MSKASSQCLESSSVISEVVPSPVVQMSVELASEAIQVLLNNALTYVLLGQSAGRSRNLRKLLVFLRVGSATSLTSCSSSRR